MSAMANTDAPVAPKHIEAIIGEDHLALARAALADHDLVHAVQHAGLLVADHPIAPNTRLLLADLLNSTLDKEAIMVPAETGMFYGGAVVRAYILAHTGRVMAALQLLFQVAHGAFTQTYAVRAHNTHIRNSGWPQKRCCYETGVKDFLL